MKKTERILAKKEIVLLTAFAKSSNITEEVAFKSRKPKNKYLHGKTNFNKVYRK